MTPQELEEKYIEKVDQIGYTGEILHIDIHPYAQIALIFSTIVSISLALTLPFSVFTGSEPPWGALGLVALGVVSALFTFLEFGTNSVVFRYHKERYQKGFQVKNNIYSPAEFFKHYTTINPQRLLVYLEKKKNQQTAQTKYREESMIASLREAIEPPILEDQQGEISIIESVDDPLKLVTLLSKLKKEELVELDKRLEREIVAREKTQVELAKI